MSDKQLEALLDNYKIKSQELAAQEAIVDQDLSVLTYDEPISYYNKLKEYCECADSIKDYLKIKYGLDNYQTLLILYGDKLEDVLSEKTEDNRERKIELYVQEYWRRHKKSFIELAK